MEIEKSKNWRIQFLPPRHPRLTTILPVQPFQVHMHSVLLFAQADQDYIVYTKLQVSWAEYEFLWKMGI